MQRYSKDDPKARAQELCLELMELCPAIPAVAWGWLIKHRDQWDAALPYNVDSSTLIGGLTQGVWLANSLIILTSPAWAPDVLAAAGTWSGARISSVIPDGLPARTALRRLIQYNHPDPAVIVCQW